MLYYIYTYVYIYIYNIYIYIYIHHTYTYMKEKKIKDLLRMDLVIDKKKSFPYTYMSLN